MTNYPFSQAIRVGNVRVQLFSTHQGVLRAVNFQHNFFCNSVEIFSIVVHEGLPRLELLPAPLRRQFGITIEFFEMDRNEAVRIAPPYCYLLTPTTVWVKHSEQKNAFTVTVARAVAEA